MKNKIMKLSLYLFDWFDKKYKIKYNEKVYKKLQEIHNVKNADDEYRMYIANKINVVIIGVIVTLFFILLSQSNAKTDKKELKENKIKIEDNHIVKLPEFEEGSKSVILNAKIQNKNNILNQTFNLLVPAKLPTDKEAVERVKKNLSQVAIKNKNKSLQKVVSSLNLQTKNKYKVNVTWECKDDLVNVKTGEIVRQSKNQGDKKVVLTAKISKNEIQDIKNFNITILEDTKTKNEQSLENDKQKLELYIKQLSKNKDNKDIVLPQEINLNSKIIYSQVFENKDKNDDTIIIFILGIVVIVSIIYFQDTELEKKIKNRRRSIEIDFPDFLNKLMLLINAGMTVKRAWEKVVLENKKDTVLYQQAKVTYLELQSGVYERDAYEKFAQRCKIAQITKFVSVIVQALQKGNSELVTVLRTQTLESFEMRKNNAKRLGEEASTKLIFPLMLMFIVVMIIVIYPAILAMKNI